MFWFNVDHQPNNQLLNWNNKSNEIKLKNKVW